MFEFSSERGYRPHHCRLLAYFVAYRFVERDQALVGKVAFFALCFLGCKLVNEMLNSRHLVDVGLLDVKIQGAGYGVFAAGDGFKFRRRTID